jgi:glutamine amidotransferase
MHNGQIGDWLRVRRRVEQMIPDTLYEHRLGTTDSEAILLAAMANGLEDDPVGAIARTLRRIHGLMLAADVTEALRFTAALTDGERFWAFRWASDSQPATLYWREDSCGLVVVSEPIDDKASDWHAVPNGGCLTVVPGEPLRMSCMQTAVAAAA